MFYLNEIIAIFDVLLKLFYESFITPNFYLILFSISYFYNNFFFFFFFFTFLKFPE